ncbi:hypothetical protein XbrCFBP1976_09685 [Xanthomonas bromi]|uniref:Uncharacterized protein n=1 Tax=Xanthomonas bromi TaxID=56449 RepID=A0ABX5BUE6_9XANT|nr:hypothetical protein XbrCFBP1976_09685 [Xanthomonas bromi]
MHLHRSIIFQDGRILSFSTVWMFPSRIGRGRDALTACGTRRTSVAGGSVAASMPPHGPASAKDIAPANLVVCGWKSQRRPCSAGGERAVV